MRKCSVMHRRLFAIIGVVLSTALLNINEPAFSESFPGERYAVIVQNIGPGLAKNFRSLLIEQGNMDEDNILCYGNGKSFADLCIGKPTAENFSSGIDQLSKKVSDGDTLFVLFACHMQKGYLINNSLPYEKLNELLSTFPETTTVIVIIEGCYAAAALPILDAADIAYASAGIDEPCYGGWFHFFLDAIDQNDNAFSIADTNGDGFVSFGEAYDYAADEERLKEWYANLSRNVWPPADFYPTPSRTEGNLQYSIFLNPFAPAVF